MHTNVDSSFQRESLLPRPDGRGGSGLGDHGDQGDHGGQTASSRGKKRPLFPPEARANVRLASTAESVCWEIGGVLTKMAKIVDLDAAGKGGEPSLLEIQPPQSLGEAIDLIELTTNLVTALAQRQLGYVGRCSAEAAGPG